MEFEVPEEDVDVEQEQEPIEAISLSIELGDIIEIVAPTHQEIH